jgi:FtsP/CotA-like multicopper oxidase with cupredoxin domain
MQAGSHEFWRVANAGANTIMNVEVNYDGQPQVLQVVGLDGVPTGSQDGKIQGALVDAKNIALPPAARAEFIVAAPPQGTTKAYFITRAIDGGPASDSNPRRILAKIETTASAPHLPRMPKRSGPPNKPRFPDLMSAKVTANRTLFFSEHPLLGPKTAPEGTAFYITVDGQLLKIYDPNNPPAITTTRGAVEDWTIQNRSYELHDFHIHQIHFLLLERNGQPVPRRERQFHDSILVPYWTGAGDFPSVKVRMDFRGAVIGDFVYHCHILDHEDGGMMAIIRVLPRQS